MPRQVAVISLIAGIAVATFGVALLFVPSEPAEPLTQAPIATLEPVDQPDDAPVNAPEDMGSDITGRVLSVDEEGVADVEVELIAIADGPKTRETTTDARGRYAFRDVEIDLGSPHVVEAIYDGARFGSSVLRAPRGSDPNVDITVAETTRSDDDLVVEVESLALVGDRSGLQAVHALTLRNRGDRAFVGKLELPLLRGAANIQEGAGIDRRTLVLGHGGMTSTKPILPGATEITYTYVTPMAADGVAFVHEPQLRTDRYVLLVAGDLDAVDLRGLVRASDVSLDARRGLERTYERSVANDLEARSPIGARIVVDEGPDLLRVGAPVAAAAIALLLVAFGLWRRRRQPPPPSEAVVEPTPASA
jgi:hypothetical protein